MRQANKGWLAAALVLLFGAPLWAQTTGRIVGQVVDSSSAPVPGVSVSVTSPALQGAQTSTTDSKGQFRFLALPPGSYKVKTELAGFKTVERDGIVVGIDRTVDLALKMDVAGVLETVTVTGEAPVVDTASATTGVNATTDMFERLPVQRDFYSIARVAPGTQDDGVGTSFYGSSGAENQYVIEGLNTTGVEVGDKGKTLNFDFVQEIEIKTGGLPAEYGRITGGLINVLTKSGGNQFSGSVFGFFEGGGLSSDNTTAADRPNTTTTVRDNNYKRDFGATLGGYVVKDKLWFFGSYNRVNEEDERTLIRQLSAPGSPAVGDVIPAQITRDLYAAKLTYRISPDHTLTGSLFGDPSEQDTGGPYFAISGPPSTWDGTNKLGGSDAVVRYDGVFGSAFLLNAMYGRHRERNEIYGNGRVTEQLIDQTVSPNATSGGFGFFQDQPSVKRDVFKLDMTKFVGSHQFKLGGDMEDVEITNNNYNGGNGQRIYKRRTSSGVIYYRHRFYVDDRASGYDRNNPATWTIARPLTSIPTTKNLSAYLQDSWKITPALTLNLGVRWEQQDVQNRDGDTAFKLDQNWAPRLGFIWDFTGKGKGKLYGNYGRFFESVPMDINIRAFGGEVQCFCYNFSPDPNNYLQAPNAPARQSLLGGAEPVDPDLKGQYLDEFLGGFEYEVAPNFALGAKFSYRKLGRVIEDFLVDPANGQYAIANLGEGTLGQKVYFYDYVTDAPAPKAERTNYSFEVSARKRFSNNWQFLASYVWSKLEGNYDGTFQNSTGQLDPNINSAFDYADFLVNSYGRLSAERQHQLKFDGSYQFSGALDGLNLGLSTYWYSGLPLNAYGFSQAYANWEYYLVPRGSLGRGPSEWEADLHVSYPVKLGQKARLNLVADVFNIFNRQAISQLDERYNLNSDPPCSGIPDSSCNGDGGLLALPNTVDPAFTIANARATATNPDFLEKGIGFTSPRSIRLGVRLTF